MVKNTRETRSPGPIRALNQPELVQVKESRAQGPVAVNIRHRRLKVVSIEDVWEIADEWWRAGPIARRYYQVSLEGGTTATIFRDLVSGLWYEQRA